MTEFVARHRERLQEAAGVGLLLVACYLMISLLTWDPGDLGFRVYPAGDEVLNRGGRMGAHLARWFYFYFGLGAFFLVGLIGFWGTRFFFRQEAQGAVSKVSAILGTLIAASVLFSLQGILAPHHLGLELAMHSSGGMYGEIGAEMLYRTLGWGSYLLAIAILFGCLLIASDWTLLDAMRVVAPRAAGALKRLPAPWKLRGLPSFGRRNHDDDEEDDEEEEDEEPVAPPRKAKKSKPLKAKAPEPEEEEEEEEDEDDDEEEEEPAPKPELKLKPKKPAQMELPNMPKPSPKPKADKKIMAKRADTSTLLPPVEVLEEHESTVHQMTEEEIEARKSAIEESLAEFKVQVKVVDHQIGPVLTTYVLEPGKGLKFSKLASFSEDLALSLKSTSVRIFSPIPGTSYVGVEVPNPYTETVGLRDMLETASVDPNKKPLPLYLGKDAAGNPIVASLTEMPNLLIAGTVGSGKSVCINTIVLSLLYSHPPDELKMIMVDPKMVELSGFGDLPHLWAPVITDMQKAPKVLDWLVNEMEERYELFAMAGARKIASFNKMGKKKITERLEDQGIEVTEDTPFKLPYIVVVIDELSELMMVASKEVEAAITRLAQKSRAAGIHLVIATQRPSTDVITGLIKANIPTRVSFKVASGVDSRTILDKNGAERLLGKGDMLLWLPGSFDVRRGQCTFCNDQEIEDVVEYLKSRAAPEYHEELLSIEKGIDLDDGGGDDLFEQAVEIILTSQRGSASLLQRKLGIGYTRASRLIDMMEGMGLVGPYRGSKAREVYMTFDDYLAAREALDSQEEELLDRNRPTPPPRDPYDE